MVRERKVEEKEVKINEKEGGGGGSRFAHVRGSRLGIDSNEIGYAEC